MTQLDSPVLLIVFNRPKETSMTMSCIRKQQPKYLYVAADGPRHQRDEAACRESRRIATDVDWPCEVRTLFRSHNVGCGIGVSEAITWFFRHEERGIILEDDCVPSDSFFTFCHTLLSFYQNEEKVMMISGTNFIAEHCTTLRESYYYSSISNVWGWATWRRAWQRYDYNMSDYADFKKQRRMEEVFDSGVLRQKYDEILDRYLTQDKVDTWDYQWQFALMNHRGLAIVPKSNLVTNIGFGLHATHTKRAGNYSYIPTHELPTDLIHPKTIAKNEHFDILYYQKILNVSLIERLKGLLLYWKKIIADTFGNIEQHTA
jgi:hypothetical protein